MFSQRACGLIALLLLGSLGLGCSANNYHRGRDLLSQESYRDAIYWLAKAEKRSPQNHKIKRDLGIALFKINRYKHALKKLKKAKTMNPKDSQTTFYLGMTYEAQNQTGKAIDEYRAYRTLGRSGGFKKEISKRIQQLTQRKIANEIALAIANEEKLNAERFPENTIAVLNFQNLSDLRELDPLQKGLAHMLMTDLSKVKKLKVVERLKLQELLKELQLGQTDLVDESTVPRVGKLVGARKLVNGAFTDLTDQNVRIDVSLTETTTRRLHNIDEITGQLARLFRMQKKLAFALIDDMGIDLSKEEREAIMKIPTESLLAFLAYSKGLDYEDRGLFNEAHAQYQKALSIDPQFQLAKERAAEVQIRQSAASTGMLALSQFENLFRDLEVETGGQIRMSRLIFTSAATQTGQAPQGDNDSREPFQEGIGNNDVSEAAGLDISIPLPSDGDDN
ncbi:tetratricopeptide repeat protein [candidate division KSB1 bacterium]|nr:tetratricopeptide repeat protein [candidate division KSB1 bacterium]NIR68437.1 tetratricopeptide repeat protein [candidate division KSB1 bacterium]NIS25389.1 tetratricopeptide repeat protein [candidate division KSB1 bacterium]NIT72266.1 tetratricopeptide repeat protein [candidate division KSB1 bacterium]NIU26071.1 tetratricopeptide repeat protein [candidate division KSB1 bacterium]